MSAVRVEDAPGENDGEAVLLRRQVNAEAGIVVVSDTQGVDFSSYLSKDVLPKIQKAWYEQVLKVGANAATKKGRVVAAFAIGKDGTVANVKLEELTNEKELDDAVRDAIEEAIPFPPLPGKFHGKELALRFQCVYNPGAAQPGAKKSAPSH